MKNSEVIVQKNGWRIVIPIAIIIALVPTVLQIFGVNGAQTGQFEQRLRKVELCVETLEKCITKIEVSQNYQLEVLKEVKDSIKELNKKVDNIARK